MRNSLRISSFGLALAVCTVSGVALAGATYAYPVWVVGTGNVYGSLAAARHSSDTVQFIGCEVFASKGATPEASCYAKTASGTYMSCYTVDRNLVTIAGQLNTTSMLQFEFNPDGECTYINVTNASDGIP